MQFELNIYISDEEREHLLSNIRRSLIWVGEPIPNTIDIDGKTIELRKLVWAYIHKKDFTEQERTQLRSLIRSLEIKRMYNEEVLSRSNLTHEDAKKLYHEIAALIRAVMSIRECEAGKIKLKEFNEEIRHHKIEDIKRWTNFLKDVGKNKE